MPRRSVIASCVVIVAAFLASSPSPWALPASWIRVQHEALHGGGYVVYVRDILPGDGANPWLAVGYIVDSAGARTPSAWTSRDGQSWTRSTMAATGAPEQRDGAYFTARRGTIAVALGARFDERTRPAAWRSVDGMTWSALTDPSDPLLAYEGDIEAVTAAPNGFVAVGVEHGPGGSLVTMFRSDDGSRWVDDGGFLTSPGEGFSPYDVVATDDIVVVVGDSALGAGSDGRIWVRRGGGWARVPPEPIGLAGPDLQQVATIVRNPDGTFLAGGLTMRLGVEVPTLWSSPDGYAWSQLPEGTLPFGDGTAVHDLVSVGDGLLAAGNSGSGPKVWRSENGRDWSVVAAPSASNPGGELVRIAAAGNVTVLLVTRDTGSKLYRRLGGEWKPVAGAAFPAQDGVAASLDDVATTGGRVVSVGNDGRGRPLLMLRQGAGGWRRVAFRDPAARLLAVTANRGVFAIAGWRLIDGKAHLALWTSTTATTWRRLGGTRSDPVGAFADIAPDGNRFLAVAFEGTVRGLFTTVWAGDRFTWRSAAGLGYGEARAVCVGPGRATAVAVAGDGSRSRILAWRRSKAGRWTKEPEVVSSAAEASRCADGPSGTVVAGANNVDGAAMSWKRSAYSERWQPAVIGNTAPRTTVNDVVRDGSAFLASGSTGARGQVDLAVWRSADGVVWTRRGGVEPVFVEPGFQVGLGIVRARAKLVVVGRNGAGDAGLWVGT